MHTIRETGDYAPAPQGDVPEMSRRQAMKALLEVDAKQIEVRLYRHYAPWHLRLRLRLDRWLTFAVLVFALQVAALSGADAARIMLQLQSPANRTHTSAPPALPTGARSFVLPSRPGDGPFGPFSPRPEWAPLNCCQTYVIPFAVPRVEVIIRKPR